jgi:hypothetical protein
MLKGEEVKDLKDLQDYSDQGIQIEINLSKDLQSLNLEINQVNMLISCDSYSGTGLEISKEVNLMGLA